MKIKIHKMKKRLLFATHFFFICFATAQNNSPTPQDLFGTWSATYTIGDGYGYPGTTMKIYFTLYEDFRNYTIMDYGLVSNGTWKVEDDIFVIFNPSENTTTKLKSLSFNGRNWTYKGLADNIIYKATKLSDTPKYIPKTDLSGNRNPLDPPQSNIINIDKLHGTWKSKNNKTGEEYYFTLYTDQRILNNNGVTGTWTIIGDKFYFYVDYIAEPFISKTTSFSETGWQYLSLESGETFTAKKISDKAQELKIKVTPADSEVGQNKNENIKKGVCSVYSPNYTCMVCYGTCKQNCFLCGGSGKNRNNEYDCIECSGTGREKCDCKCRAHDGLIDVSLRSKKVPCNEVIHGTWKSSLGEFTFYPNSTSNGYLLTKYSNTGSWIVEDGLFKMLFTSAMDSEWEKYYIKDFDNSTMVLRPVDGYGEFTFRKIK